jgi:UDP-3-O-[3-hydroxymyristoyl] glucosamine N-acyltransferase
MKLSEICEKIDVSFTGEDIEIDGLHTLGEANASQISFLNDLKYKDQLSTTKAAAVLISSKNVDLLPTSVTPLVTEEVYLKLAIASKFFAHTISIQTEVPKVGEGCNLDPKANFGSGVVLGNNVTVMAGAYLGDNVNVGDNTLIYPNVVIYHNCSIGDNCIVHAGTVIGSDGYGFAHTREGKHVKLYQNGNVVLESHVEIGANCTIDRAVFGTTYIRKGSKLDNLIQVAHNCDIGEHSLLAAQVGLAGSTKMGRNIVMGGQSASAGHLHMGDFTTIAGKGGVTRSLKGGQTYAGFPAIEHKKWLKLQAKLSFLLKGKSK